MHEITLTPEEAFDTTSANAVIATKLGLPLDGSVPFKIVKRSIDARSRHVIVRMQCALYPDKKAPANPYSFQYPNIMNADPVIIVGAGPAGLFAALRLIEAGVKPIVLERGKDVQARRRDIAAINKEHIVHPDSNYCFGEGGAGTYSDGKLYTRSTKRGDVNRILELFIAHGAKEDIRYDAHPHIGTNKLPPLIASMRDQIRAAGGEVHFETKVTDVLLADSAITGVVTANGGAVKGKAVILATGHSARDVFELLHKRNVLIEAKPFALGVRVEHHQTLIDQIQYHCPIDRGAFLPASSYALVHQASVDGKNRGVFSFCMCPGGFIVPSATSPGEVVVNGMSPSRRDSVYANSGVVVALQDSDFGAFNKFGPLAGMYFQQAIEQQACREAGNTQAAPAQRLVDFVNGKVSNSLLETSYQPGLLSTDMNAVLPTFVMDALTQGFKNFGTKMKGYLTNDAQVVGVESRTSSPVRIPRHKETLEHVQVKNLFPCGEGAGYAGGIVSAAMDGERCAEAVLNKIKK